MENIYSSPWQDHADEHVLYIRAISNVSPDAFEFVRVTSHEEQGRVGWLHGAIFLDDYLQAYEQNPERLDAILAGFGYKGLDDLVAQTATEHIKLLHRPDGTIDRVNSPGYVVDLELLASLICESRDGEEAILVEAACSEVKRITGEDLTEFIKELGND